MGLISGGDLPRRAGEHPAGLPRRGGVDGASGWQRFRGVVLPLLNPTVVFLTVTGVISNLQVFTQIRAMSSGGTGGPLDSTISVVLTSTRRRSSRCHRKWGTPRR